MSIAIRQLGLADGLMVEELLDVVEPGWADALQPGATASTAFLADAHTFMFGAYVDHDPVGWVWGVHVRRPDGRIMTYVHELDVVEAHRRKSIASLLMQAAIEEARQNGSHKLWLVTRRTNEAGNGLYVSLDGVTEEQGNQVYIWDLP